MIQRVRRRFWSSEMTRTILIVSSLSLVLGCTAPPPDGASAEFAETVRQATIPPTLAAGEAAFESNCQSCHGERGLGTDKGPPLVNLIYEPSHHADIAFFIAAQRGVRAHHWNFGDMPPQPQVEREEVEAIVAYIRFLQDQVGIR